MLAGGLLLAGSLLGGAAFAADPTPSPAAGSAEPQAPAIPPEGPRVEPSIGTWIIGGTQLEGTARPPAAPAGRPAAAPGAAAPAGRTAAHAHPLSAPGGVRTAPAGTPAGPTALPFTGGRTDLLLPVGLALLLAGAALTYLGRPVPRSAVRA